MSALLTPRPPRTGPAHAPLRVGPVSGRVPLRTLWVTLASLVLLVAVLAVNLSLGDVAVPLRDVVAVLGGADVPGATFIVLDLRLPQASVALLVGASLGLAGALCQTFARNPLASPDILGVTDGAAVGAVGYLLLVGSSSAGVAGLLAQLGLAGSALAGGFGAAVLLYVLSWRRGVDGQRFVLVGIGLSFALAAMVSWLLVSARLQDVASAQVWLTGSLNARSWEQAVPVAVGLGVAVPVALLLVRHLNALQLGDDSARGLGVRLQTTQLGMLVVAVTVTALAVSAAGPLEFVALAVPQIALRLVGGSRPPLVASMVLGAVLVVAADVIGRVLLPFSVPAGVVTAVLGAPYLIWLLIRVNRKVSA
ncbi:iron chelate uptake ABC transporter family permease subunit [uncultured Nocardioides sp.]|uniref:FecCD family ABC transporter permease n=1 Tax=uncultured Nocardioides sp. TaxID=198441 RepID=UPI00262F3F14|nr:iron chelate uptake ABC transporter family permease subunit [uncultured Nocardioides sp.]